jgi:hypothetical protein
MKNYLVQSTVVPCQSGGLILDFFFIYLAKVRLYLTLESSDLLSMGQDFLVIPLILKK